MLKRRLPSEGGELRVSGLGFRASGLESLKGLRVKFCRARVLGRISSLNLQFNPKP